MSCYCKTMLNSLMLCIKVSLKIEKNFFQANIQAHAQMTVKNTHIHSPTTEWQAPGRGEQSQVSFFFFASTSITPIIRS